MTSSVSSMTPAFLRQDVDELGPLLVAAVEPLERVERRHVAGSASSACRYAATACAWSPSGPSHSSAIARCSSTPSARPPRRSACSPASRPAPATSTSCGRSRRGSRAPRVWFGVERERLLLRRDGVVEVAEVLAVPAADLHPQVGRGLRIGDGLHDLRVLAEQVVPLVGGRRQPLELARRSRRSA